MAEQAEDDCSRERLPDRDRADAIGPRSASVKDRVVPVRALVSPHTGVHLEPHTTYSEDSSGGPADST